MKRYLTLLFLILLCAPVICQPKTKQLLPPVRKGGMPLMEALDKRCSTRDFTDRDLPEQTLSNLLWAAFGINREESDKHTAPSSNNNQEIDIYVVTAHGAYKYVPKGHLIEIISDEDFRAICGEQAYVATAAINLVYVSDLSRTDQKDLNAEPLASYSNVGFIAQNVYLFCASEGLGAVIRGWINKEALQEKLQLKPNQKIILSQSVGFPKK
ncbi:MAG: SagB/ThcOx family dehydrogenase [Bacteroidia bacterium]|jgi:SagB-type dehydrogenase family enzyme